MGGDDIIIRFLAIDLVSGVADRAGYAIERMAGRMGSGMAATGRAWMSTGAAIAQTGLMVAAAAASFALGAYEAVRAANDYNSQLVLLITHANMLPSLLGKVHDDLLKLGPELGWSPTQLAHAFYEVQSAATSLPPALQNLASLEDILAQAAKLAQIGHADLDATTRALVSVLAAYANQNLSASTAAAILNRTVGEGRMRMSDLAAAFAGGLLPVAAQAGVSIQSLGAALATLTDEGVPATRAATYLRSAIIQMTVPSGPAAKALKAIGLGADEAATRVDATARILEAAGVTVTQVARKLQESGNLADVMQMLHDRMVSLGMSAPQAAALLAKAFGGIRSGTGVVGLYDNLTGLQQKMKDNQDAVAHWGDTWAEFQRLDPTFIVKKIEAAFDSLKIHLGEALGPAFRLFATSLFTVIGAVDSFIQHNSRLVGVLVPLLIVAMSVAGLFLTLGGAMIFAAGAGMAWIGLIASVSGTLLPLLGILAILTGVAIVLAPVLGRVGRAIGQFVANVGSRGPFEALRRSLLDVGVGAGSAAILITSLRQAWREVLPGLGQVRAGLVAIWRALRGSISTQQFRDLRKAIVDFALAADRALPYVASFLGFMAKLDAGTMVAFAVILGVYLRGMVIGFTATLGLAAAAIRIAVDLFEDLGQTIGRLPGYWHMLQSSAAAVVTAVVAAVMLLWASITSTWSRITSATEAAWRTFAERPAYWVGYAAGLIIGTLLRILGSVAAFASQITIAAEKAGLALFNGIVSWATKLPGQLLSFLTTSTGHVAHFGSDMQTQGEAAGFNLVNSFLSFLSQLPDMIADWIGRSVGWLLSGGLAELANAGLRAGSAVTDAVMGEANKLPGQLVQVGIDAATGFLRGVQSMRSWITGQLTSFFGGLVDGIKHSLGIQSPSVVMAQVVGVPMAQGVALGMRQAAPGVMQAAQYTINQAVIAKAQVASAPVQSGDDYGRLTYMALLDILDAIRNGGSANSKNSSNLESLLYSMQERADQNRRLGLRGVTV